MNCKPSQRRSSTNLLKSLKDSRKFWVTETLPAAASWDVRPQSAAQ
jgi:hypothetical protein